MIDDLLRYSRLGLKEVREEPLDLGEVIDGVLSDLEGQIRQKGAELLIQRPLPKIMGDRTLVSVVLFNLLDNAMKYVRPGERPVIEVATRREKGWVILMVRDRGIGIPRQFQEKIFNLFQRLQSDEEYPGTGVGLAIVRKAVELIGGKV